MSDWTTECDCCNETIKKIRNDDYTYSNCNLDDTPHTKHNKIWVASIASFPHYEKTFEKLDPDSKIGELTVKDLDNLLELKLNLKFGQYYHGQTDYKEIWLTPKGSHFENIDYFVSGKIDGVENDILIELKTTWVSSKAKMNGVIDRAQTQADIYSWMAGYKEVKIIVKNLAKPELDTVVNYRPDISKVESLLGTYIEENKEFIKQY